MSVVEPFRFKQFSIKHDQCAMKVGTDAVLLGAWMNLEDAKTILEIGTGSGVIALIAAQRTPSNVIIDAIEIEKVDSLQAVENVLSSPWPNKVAVHHISLQQFENKTKYDFIFSNPPYFKNSLLPPTHDRARARHNNHLSFEELIFHSLRLLNTTGKLAFILPVEEGNFLKELAKQNDLYLIRQCAFYARKEKPQERWLMEFSRFKANLVEENLLLYEKDSIQTQEYINLTKDFYL